MGERPCGKTPRRTGISALSADPDMNELPPALWSMPWREAVLTVFATGDDSPLTLDNATAVLRADELARAGRFHFAADRERWIRSRALLRLCLAHRLSIPA